MKNNFSLVKFEVAEIFVEPIIIIIIIIIFFFL